MPASDQGIRTGKRYQLIPRTLIFATCGERVLLLRGSPSKRIWAGLYNGIGGHIESGESVLEAAQRELLEETGIAGVDLRLVGIITVDTGEDPGVCIFVFQTELQEEVVVLPQASPEGYLDWMSIDQLRGLPVVEDLPVLIQKIIGREPGEAPFMAAYTYNGEGHLIIRFT